MTVAGDALTAAIVVDIDGDAKPLGALWRDRPALLIWVRHFG